MHTPHTPCSVSLPSCPFNEIKSAPTFSLAVLIVFGVGSGVGYRVFLWYNDDIVSLLGQRLVERNALYQKGQLLSVLSPEITLARKMASSPC